MTRFAESTGAIGLGFRLVAIDRPIAFKFQLETALTEVLQTRLDGVRSERDLSTEFISNQFKTVLFKVRPQHDLLRIRSSCINLKLRSTFMNGANLDRALHMIALDPGPTSGPVQVVRHRGRCCLTDGYHRVFARCRAGGVTASRCRFREIDEYERLGASGGLETFERELLESAHPPRCAPLTLERAYPVALSALLI
jgi:hypothetical protein